MKLLSYSALTRNLLSVGGSFFYFFVHHSGVRHDPTGVNYVHCRGGAQSRLRELLGERQKEEGTKERS